jgi:hypothetical protein
MTMAELQHVVFDLVDVEDATAEELLAKQRELHEMFVDHLVEWNLTDEDTGEPYPPTLVGLQSLEPQFISAILRLWRAGRAAAVADEDGELPAAASDVESRLAAIPMRVGA